MSDYHINVFPSEDDGGWIADIPDLACCSAFGATPHEALTEALLAKSAWLDAARAASKTRSASAFPPRHPPGGVDEVAVQEAKAKK